MASNLHDTIGHTFCSIVAQLEAGEKLVQRDPERAMKVMARVRDIVLAGLWDVRQSVKKMREQAVCMEVGKPHWERLIDAFSHSAGVEVVLHATEDFATLPVPVDEVVYRVIQEGVTNAYRHGLATHIDVRVWWTAGKLLIRVSDNGRGAVAIKAGFGLLGMQERVESVGGKLAWQSEPGHDFHLGASIPMRGGGVYGANPSSDSR